eukprot:9496720-Pyramimonas_sp.AAC.1
MAWLMRPPSPEDQDGPGSLAVNAPASDEMHTAGTLGRQQPNRCQWARQGHDTTNHLTTTSIRVYPHIFKE